MRLSEAFKALDALNEDTFTLSDDGIKKLAEFENNDDLVDELSIIDLDAETEDDFEESYVGKVILDCCVCHSKLYKDKEDLEIDEESAMANVGEECPYCYTADGFKIVGEVAAFNKDSEEVDDDEVVNNDETNPDEVDNDLTDSDNTNNEDDDEVTEELTESIDGEDEKNEEEPLEEGIFGKKSTKSSSTFKVIDGQHKNTIKGGFKTKDDAYDWIETNKEPHEYSQYSVVTEDLDESNPINEDVNNVNVETDEDIINVSTDDSGKVTVTTEPKTAEAESGDEVIVPVSPETENDILNNEDSDEAEFSEEEVDMSFDDFDEESFDDLGEQYFKESYENVDSFKTVNVTEVNEGLLVEGVIKFTSGSSKKTSFIFESNEIDKDNNLKFIVENKEMNNGKVFSAIGNVKENKLILESLSYDYEEKDEEGNVNKISGTVKRG